MFHTTALLTLLLQSISAFAAPASISPTLDLSLDSFEYINLATNGSGIISYPVDGTSITLLIKPIPSQKITRNDLIVTLYDAREYLNLHIKQKGNSRLSNTDNPFSSSAIPNPPKANCELTAKSGELPKQLTYKYLGDAVQGLMDYTFYPYSASTDSLMFAVNHTLWGVLGAGTLEATKPASVAL